MKIVAGLGLAYLAGAVGFIGWPAVRWEIAIRRLRTTKAPAR